MGNFATLIVLTFVLAFFFHTTSSAQMQSYENEDLFEAAALSDYISTIDQLTLDDIRSAIFRIQRHGLNPTVYWTGDMEQSYQRGGRFRKDLKTLTNRNFLQLLRDLYSGSVHPLILGPDVKLIKKRFITPKELRSLVLTSGKRAEPVVERVAPQNPPYLAIKNALQKIYPTCLNGSWKEITPHLKVLKFNMRNYAVIDIKRRLTILGYRISFMDDLFDGEVLAAISDIQWNLGMNPDGIISPNGKVWNYLTISCMDRMRQLQSDMEKARWLPHKFEQRYIIVNLAMTYFALVDRTFSREFVMSFRTISGRAERKTPTMRDEITTIVFNPYWVVPPTIFIEDKVVEIKNLPPSEINNYFNVRKFEVWNKAFTHRIDPATIDWWGISQGTAKADIYIRQKPHLENALGVIRFELTNSFSIYLHDTNQRNLFSEPMRQISSGCIRLEKPFDLAEYLLRGTRWNRSAIEAIVAKPGEVIAKSTKVPLNKVQRIPVYFAYLTSHMSSDGVVRFAEDLYGQNSIIQQNISGPF